MPRLLQRKTVTFLSEIEQLASPSRRKPDSLPVPRDLSPPKTQHRLNITYTILNIKSKSYFLQCEPVGSYRDVQSGLY